MKRALRSLNFICLTSMVLTGSLAFSANPQKQAAVAGSGDISRAHPISRTRTESRPPIDWVAPPGHTISEIETIEHDCFDAVNKERSARGREPLEFDPDLLQVARAYSLRMAEEGFFNHRDPDGNLVTHRVASAGIRWRMLAENLAYEKGYVSPTAITITGWMESPGHRKNILEPQFVESAIGVWISSDDTVYFTEIFLKD